MRVSVSVRSGYSCSAGCPARVVWLCACVSAYGGRSCEMHHPTDLPTTPRAHSPATADAACPHSSSRRARGSVAARWRRPSPPTPCEWQAEAWMASGGVNGKRRRGWRRRVQGRARERARVRKEPWGAERAIHRWVHSPVEPFTGGAIRRWSHSQVEPFTGGAIHSWSRADLAADGVRGLTCRTQSPCRSFVCWPCTPSQSPWASRRTWARARVGVRVEPGGAGGAGWG